MSYPFEYITQGTCCKLIRLVIENDTIMEVEFVGGCHGNLQGIQALIKGMPCDKVYNLLKGIRCGNKTTSCPDQLAQAICVAKKQFIDNPL